MNTSYVSLLHGFEVNIGDILVLQILSQFSFLRFIYGVNKRQVKSTGCVLEEPTNISWSIFSNSYLKFLL